MKRADFPSLTRDQRLIYLDSAATTQKPQVVIDAVRGLYESGIANPGRGLYPLSIRATEAVSQARQTVADFIGAQSANEIVFLSGATEAINVVARGLNLQPGDEVIVSTLEHHSNLLPWQQAGAILKYLPINPKTGEIEIGEIPNLLSERTRVISLSLVSNVLGSRSPLEKIRTMLQGSGARLIIDACQAVPHAPLAVQNLGADFVVFSGHKIYAPSGIGVLWGSEEALASLAPGRPGGGSVETVTSKGTVWKNGPERLEGGTPNLEGIVGLSTAITWMNQVGYEAIAAHTAELVAHTRAELQNLPSIKLTIDSTTPATLVSFSSSDVHAHDIAQMLADHNICVRAGHHCASPLHESLDLAATCRISFGLYNTTADIDALIVVLSEILERFRNA